jgi:DNA-binding transcriptional LysR family regulator
MSNLADFEAFAAVCEARSFRHAAALRGVSASALSEALRRLEARLGVRLLNRTTRSVTPTEAGERLLHRLLPALGEVASAVEELGDYRNGATGTLRLNVPGVVARVILPPIAARFLRAHPGIALEVTSDDRFIDVLAAGFDAGVRYDSRLEKDMIAVPLGPRTQRFVTAAARTYLDANGTPIHPRDLLKHACIRHRFPSGVIAPWEFERGKTSLKISVHGPLVATNMEMEVEAAVQGLGVVHTFAEFLAPMLAEKRLKRVLDEWSPHFGGPSLYYKGGRHVPSPLRAFVDFLRREDRSSRSDKRA